MVVTANTGTDLRMSILPLAIDHLFLCSVKVNLMTTINSLTTSLYVSQTTISISSTKSTHNDEDTERPAVSGRGEKHGHHHGGGAFMRNVMQTLQSFGLNIPGGNSDSAGDDTTENNAGGGQNNSSNLGQLLQTFLQDLRQVLKQSGVQQTSTAAQGDASAVQTPPKQVTPTTTTSTPVTTSAAQAPAATPATSVQNNAGTPATTTTVPVTNTSTATTTTSAPRATVADVRQALHSFLHDLRQALKYSADRRHGSDDDVQHGDRGVGRNGYGKFTDNLQNLITALSDANGATGGKYKELQDSFNELVNLLGTPVNGKKPTLLEFLNKLSGNRESNSPTPGAKGSILTATA
ncbi:hypothetical protein RO575_17865 [Methylomonas sp. MO1]|uniref:hypothetical protein n=1 Tax=unclassified Methylomonas TaxID=2608980 RepID=UPI0012DF8A6F|nr:MULTISPECIES: hypothetical protein [unclassified Methylomonas]MDT4291437.1 hypothetical protein [Methylomonas sp. MO1]